MNEKYLIGAAIGFAAAYMLLNRSAQVVDSPPPVRPQNPTYPPARQSQPQNTLMIQRGRIGIRPWQTARSSARPMYP